MALLLADPFDTTVDVVVVAVVVMASKDEFLLTGLLGLFALFHEVVVAEVLDSGASAAVLLLLLLLL